MRKIQLETLEKINEERKLNKEAKEKIRRKTLKNFLFATAILFFFAFLRLMAINIEKQLTILVYKELSIGILAITLILFEVAYKKDSDSLAITSIEIFFVSIATLLAPYILVNRVNVYTSSVGVFFGIYYCIKNFIIYRNEKKQYLKENNDISQIVKKESKDELAQAQIEKRRQEKEEKPKRKKGRLRKAKNEE